MALISTNHRMLYVIGSSGGGSFTGVITNETLTGNGTSAFPLGVNESALSPSEAEIYVQTNSGNLNEVSSVVQSNSADWNLISGISGAYVPLSALDCSIGYNNSAGAIPGIGTRSFAQGSKNYARNDSFAQGGNSKAINTAFAQGYRASSMGPGAFSQGYNVQAEGAAFAQGYDVSSIGPGAFSQGYQNFASQCSLAQGMSNTANGGLAQGSENLSEGGAAIGAHNTAKNTSFTLGTKNSAFETSIAQGFDNIAQYYSFAQGIHNSAYEGGLAQGTNNYASAASIAVGDRTSAEHYSQAFGVGTTAGNNGMAIGAFNKITNAAFVIGNGTANYARSDLFVIYPDGSVSAQGKISANGVELGAGDEEVNELVHTNSASWADGGSGDEEVNSFVYNNSATINEVNTAYQTHSASYQPSGNYIPYTAYGGAWGYQIDSPITVKNVAFTATLQNSNIQLSNNVNRHTVLSPIDLRFKSNDASAQVDISSINKWNDTSNVVQSNSAQWAEGGAGDEEVNELVHTNSATWNTVTDKLDTTAQVVTGYTTATMEGTNAINSLNGKPLISWRTQSAQEAGIANYSTKDNLGRDITATYLTGVSIPESATWQDVSTTVQSNSAQWGQGGGSIPVSHDNTLSGNGMADSPLGVILSATNDANVNNIVVTASLPSTPDANTLYLIPEA